MDFHTHRPDRQLGRGEQVLVKIAKDLTRFLTKAQRSLTFDTLQLSSRKRETLAHIVVEFAEDLYQDIGIWRALEQYNLAYFGTKLPCILQPDEEMESEPVNPERLQYLLWTLYDELEPELILAPNHQDLQFVNKLVQEYGDQSIASAFLIPRETDQHYLGYLLRRYKGHFYRNRYPSLTIVDH
jgi:hypothetical protein